MSTDLRAALDDLRGSCVERDRHAVTCEPAVRKLRADALDASLTSITDGMTRRYPRRHP